LFSHLIFLILALLLINLGLEINEEIWTIPAGEAFFYGVLAYLSLCIFIYFQARVLRKKYSSYKDSWIIVVSIEVLIFLAIFHFILGAHRIYDSFYILGKSYALKSLISLSLYFFALGLYYYVSSTARKPSKDLENALQPIRLVLPFVFPFILFMLLADLIQLIPSEALPAIFEPGNDTLVSLFVFVFFSVVFMLTMMIFLPFIIVRVWNCQPLEDSPLKMRLEALCNRAQFRHAGIQTWTIMNHSLTAAIVGIVPKIRYVMFTKRLLQELPPESIEAILAHEIGHSYRKHLLLFPFIFLGMLVCTALFSAFFSQPLEEWFLLQMKVHPSTLWNVLYPLTIFIIYAFIITVYFRYVFGLFSRLFERQADLHGFELKLNPQHMINALDDVAVATGFTHFVPNWHHYSIQERIDFLKKTIENPKLIQKHHQRTRRYFYCYLVLLIAALVLLISPLISY
jgi:Zn-dependent protease with chaperone function